MIMFSHLLSLNVAAMAKATCRVFIWYSHSMAYGGCQSNAMHWKRKRVRTFNRIRNEKLPMSCNDTNAHVQCYNERNETSQGVRTFKMKKTREANISSRHPVTLALMVKWVESYYVWRK